MAENKVKEATLILLNELRNEIEKGDTQEINYSRVSEKIALVSEPVRYLAHRERARRKH